MWGKGSEEFSCVTRPMATILAANGSANINVNNSGSAKTTAADSLVQTNSNSSGAVQLDGLNSEPGFAPSVHTRSSTNSSGSAQTSYGGVAQTKGKGDIGMRDDATGTATVTVPNSRALRNSLSIGNSNGADSSTNTGVVKAGNGATVTANGNASGADGGISIGSKSNLQQDELLNGNGGAITGNSGMNGEISSPGNFPGIMNLDGDLNGSLQHGLLGR